MSELADALPPDQTGRREYTVVHVDYVLHMKRGAPEGAPRSLRVTYEVAEQSEPISEWVCLEHQGYPRRKAETWWRERSREPVPTTVVDALQLAGVGALRQPARIVVETEPGSAWPRVVEAIYDSDAPSLGDLWPITPNTTEQIDAQAVDQTEPDDIPF